MLHIGGFLLRDPAARDIGRQKLKVDFSSPNVASEFKGKHLRSMIIGFFLNTPHESVGWNVTKINYLGVLWSFLSDSQLSFISIPYYYQYYYYDLVEGSSLRLFRSVVCGAC
jgi:tRNA synthetases class I (R)